MNDLQMSPTVNTSKCTMSNYWQVREKECTLVEYRSLHGDWDSLSHCRKSRLESTVQPGSFSMTQSGSYITVSSTMEVWYIHCVSCSHRLGTVLIRAHPWSPLLCVHVHVLVPDEKCTSMHIADTHACTYQSPSPGSPQHGWWGLAGISQNASCAVGD